MERHHENALIVYTDGSMLQKPRRGGYAYRLLHVDEDGNESDPIDSNEPGYLNATSNQMELMAYVEALRLITGRRSPFGRASYRKIVFYTDSTYVQDNLYQAEHVWPKPETIRGSWRRPASSRTRWMRPSGRAPIPT